MFSEILTMRLGWMITLTLHSACGLCNTEVSEHSMELILFTIFMLSTSLYNLKHILGRK